MTTTDRSAQRLRLEIEGAVQGVGFRPFVYRLARELDLSGWVLNDGRGVFVEAEGPEDRLRELARRIESEAPPRSVIEELRTRWLSVVGFDDFDIRASSPDGNRQVVLLPDVATCPECSAEIFDPENRRFRYPFTNCTDCGPRFSIILDLPYDRPHTTMRSFRMCPACRAEYEDPGDRRFHAQPNACPECGPSLTLVDDGGHPLGTGDAALRGAAGAVRGGLIVAVKGLGGFHLLVDAADETAVRRLRDRKHREEKPLALMVRDLGAARRLCRLSPEDEGLLSTPEAPILLALRRSESPVAPSVAPNNPRLGIMLPPTPMHHLLMAEIGRPVVATSGNLSDEPICIDDEEALERLGGIADRFLVHDRPIARHVDDSVVSFVAGAVQPLRRARGLAPMPIRIPREGPPILAVGAHLKNTVALAVGERVFVSQHIGDLETPQALDAFERVIDDFVTLYDVRPALVVHDLHPDYLSTRWAQELASGRDPGSTAAAWRREVEGVPRLAVQHHHAHLAACLAEHGREDEILGIVWDGTGYGSDGTVWGGEALLGSAAGFRRVARLRPFRLPGGDAAIRKPVRTALALLFEVFGEEASGFADLPLASALGPGVLPMIRHMLVREVRSPVTTSAGRLFDGVASIVGLRHRSLYEGQAAMELEWTAAGADADGRSPPVYPLPIETVPGEDPSGGDLLELDWRPTVAAVAEDVRRGLAPGIIALGFHGALARAVVEVARHVGAETVALSGGCFQNRLLTEGSVSGLREAGHEVLVHRRVPPNDGGISLGQIAVGSRFLKDHPTS